MVAHSSSSEANRRGREGGFTYLGLLFALALLGLALGAAGTVWSAARQRDRERQLLWAGGEIREAIGHYYLSGPGGLRAFPRSIDDLLEDRRGPTVVRHLRQAYRDPMTDSPEGEWIRGADGSLTGVASLGRGKPIKQKGFTEKNLAFEDMECYCDWRFVYVPELQRRPSGASVAGGRLPAPSSGSGAGSPVRP